MNNLTAQLKRVFGAALCLLRVEGLRVVLEQIQEWVPQVES